jgi:hypothetical protein
VLIATRFAKGISAAFTLTAAFSIVTTIFEEGPARNKPLSICVATVPAGAVIGRRCLGRPTSGRPGHRDQVRSKRSRFMTLTHAATKSCTNFSPASSLA